MSHPSKITVILCLLMGLVPFASYGEATDQDVPAQIRGLSAQLAQAIERISLLESANNQANREIDALRQITLLKTEGQVPNTTGSNRLANGHGR